MVFHGMAENKVLGPLLVVILFRGFSVCVLAHNQTVATELSITDSVSSSAEASTDKVEDFSHDYSDISSPGFTHSSGEPATMKTDSALNQQNVDWSSQPKTTQPSPVAKRYGFCFTFSFVLLDRDLWLDASAFLSDTKCQWLHEIWSKSYSMNWSRKVHVTVVLLQDTFFRFFVMIRKKTKDQVNPGRVSGAKILLHTLSGKNGSHRFLVLIKLVAKEEDHYGRQPIKINLSWEPREFAKIGPENWYLMMSCETIMGSSITGPLGTDG